MEINNTTIDQPQVNANANNDLKKGVYVGAGTVGIIALSCTVALVLRLRKVLKENKEYQTEIAKLKLDKEDLIAVASYKLYTQQFANENQSQS